jgi:hypothetical protein
MCVWHPSMLEIVGRLVLQHNEWPSINWPSKIHQWPRQLLDLIHCHHSQPTANLLSWLIVAWLVASFVGLHWTMASIGHWPARDPTSFQALISHHHTALNMVLSKQLLDASDTLCTWVLCHSKWSSTSEVDYNFKQISWTPTTWTFLERKNFVCLRHELFWRGKFLNAYDMYFI